jgi:8-oxo-dGTP pyrophosphatase MutT (NUDIX family)
MSTQPVLRHAARVLLLDAQDRVLLIRFRINRDDNASVWVTPGGGLLDGETHEQAAVRELYEETGLTIPLLGTCVWIRTNICQFAGKTFEEWEHFYCARCDDGPVISRTGLGQAEAAYLGEYRWWAIDEIVAAVDEVFAPRRLGALLRE